MNTTKIVFLGAGSMSFGLSMFADLFSSDQLAGSTLTLVDTNPAALERMTRMAQRMNAESGVGMRIEAVPDRRVALDGAGFVVNAVLAGGELPAGWLEPSGERGAGVIAAALHNQRRWIESGVVFNQGAIPNLPPDLAVEVPLVVDAAGVHPQTLGPLPEGIARLLAMQAAVQQLAVEAALRGSRELALQALLIDPVVNSAAAAEKILDELWAVNRPYFRACI